MNDQSRHLAYDDEEQRKDLISAEMLAWWNGSYNKDNLSNLKYCSDGKIESKPKVLFNNWDGDTSNTIKLNDDISNYDRLLIYYKDNIRHHVSSKMVKARGSLITLDMLATHGDTIRMNVRTYELKNTTLNSTKSLVSIQPTNTRYEANELAILEVDGFIK